MSIWEHKPAYVAYVLRVIKRWAGAQRFLRAP